MVAETEKEISALFDKPTATEYFAQDASISAQAKILSNALIKKFDNLFAVKGGKIAEQAANNANRTSKIALAGSIGKLTEGLTLPPMDAEVREILNASIAENVQLIKSIPQQYLTQVQGALMRSISTEQGMKDLIPFLKEQGGITLRRAQLIARDQNTKMFANLNATRMQALNIEEYIWRHTSGSRYPRHEHVEMSGNKYRFDDPPVIEKKTGKRGKPGDLIYCNCRMQPVINWKS
jgi:uncharacterized protein with gpF-like domain